MSARRSQRSAHAASRCLPVARVDEMKKSKQRAMSELTKGVECAMDSESSALVIDIALTDYEEVVATKSKPWEAADTGPKLRAPSSHLQRPHASVSHKVSKKGSVEIESKSRDYESHAAQSLANAFTFGDARKHEIVFETCESVVEVSSVCEDVVTTEREEAALVDCSTQVIQPIIVAQKYRQFGVQEMGIPKESSRQQGVTHHVRRKDTSAKKIRQPKPVTIIDFQKVKASQSVNEVYGTAGYNVSVVAPQYPTATPSRRYYLESKTNPGISLRLSPQKAVSSAASVQQISVLLPVESQQAFQATDSRVSILKPMIFPQSSHMGEFVSSASKSIAQHGAIVSNVTKNKKPKHSESITTDKNKISIQNSMEQVAFVGQLAREQSEPEGMEEDGASHNISGTATLNRHRVQKVLGATESAVGGLPLIIKLQQSRSFLPAERQKLNAQNSESTHVTNSMLDVASGRSVHKNAARTAVGMKCQIASDRDRQSGEVAESNSAIDDDADFERGGQVAGAQTGESGSDAERGRSCRKRKTTVPIKNLRSNSEAAAKCTGGGEDKLPVDEMEAGLSTQSMEIMESVDSMEVSKASLMSVDYADVKQDDSITCSVDDKQESVIISETIVIEPRFKTEDASMEEKEAITCLPMEMEELLLKAEAAGSEPDVALQEQPISEVLKAELAAVDMALEACEEPLEDETLDVRAAMPEDVDETTPDDLVEQVYVEVQEKDEGSFCMHCDMQFADATELVAHMKATHICATCSREFKQPANLRKHVRVHHELALKHECVACGKAFAYKSALKEHELTHDAESGSPAYGCNECDKSFARISGLRRHKKVEHSGAAAFACTQCDRRYAYRCNLKNHMVTHSADRPYTCDSCGASFKQSSNLLKHVRVLHHSCSLCEQGEACTCVQPTGYECDVCGKACGGRTQLRLHQRVHSGEKPEVCDLCGQAFQHKSNLVKHRMKHTGTKPYVCSFCARGFYSNHSLQSHMRLHTGESPYQCDTCGKRFCTRNGLQVHSLLHTDARPFVCGTCGKAFAQLGNLNKHLAIHTGARPFQCTQCTMAFVDSSALRRHEVLHTREHNFACNLCDRSFMYLTSLRAHRLTHEHVKPHGCGVCGKAFRQKAGYLRHLKIHESRGTESIINLGEYVVYLTE